MTGLRRVAADAVRRARQDPVDATTLEQARAIVADVRAGGEAALRTHAERLGDLAPGAPLILRGPALQAALEGLPAADQALLRRVAHRIQDFARAQRDGLRDLDHSIEGGRAGHQIVPVARAGCYAPGGRFPLPSSVLMTAVTARAAGVAEVWVASPRPAPVTLAAAAVAGADAVLAVGGAQAIAALACGAGEVPACDVVVGPGNRWVTAAKQCIAGHTRIDFLAGPSELLVLADGEADPALIAADLLAQAEHDEDAAPMLVSLDASLLDRVDAELELQLADLPTADTARVALERAGFAVLAADLEQAIAVCDEVAPEHLQLHVRRPREVGARLSHYGALFLGSGSAEVLGDYGAGPNHVLPTSGTARFTGGLSVLDFLRVRTWLEVRPESSAALVEDCVRLARLEGLEAHARAARRRTPR